MTDQNQIQGDRQVCLVGASICLGSGKTGAQYGPQTMRELGLVERISHYAKVEDCGDIAQNSRTDDNHLNPRLKYLEQITQFNHALSNEVYKIFEQNKFPLVLGGDHSLAMGSVSGAIRKFGDNLGLIWIDAHADINTDLTSPTGNIHGMPIASLLGLGSKELTNISTQQRLSNDKVLIIAARDIDSGEEEIIRQNNISLIRMSQITQEGIEKSCCKVSKIISEWDVDNIYLSIDIDSLDSTLVPGTGTPVADGLSVEELNRLIETIMQSRKIKGVDVVELNPQLDTPEQITAQRTIDIIEQVVSKI